LDCYKLKPADAILLASELSQTALSGSLTSLLLGDNLLGDEGIVALAPGIKNSKSLSTLDLSNELTVSTPFGFKGAAALASAIALSASLTQISVGLNELRDEGTMILCNALRESTVSIVQQLDLERNGIGAAGAKAVAALCAVSGSLTTVCTEAPATNRPRLLCPADPICDWIRS
jgi:hypothetical protein